MARTAVAEKFHGLPTQMRLHRERLPAIVDITERRVVEPDELGAWFTAYRATPRKVEVSMIHPFAKPMRVSEVASRLKEFGDANQTVFHCFIESFSRAAEPVVLELPAYRLSEGELLLLDGNHRITALWMTRVPFELTLFTLWAPIDRRMLIYLKYWDGGWRRFFNRIRRGTSAGTVRRAIRSR